MFSDARSKKIVLVAHCILNQNSISDGTANFPGTNESILNLLLQANVGIVQLPCPELHCLGLDRGDIHGGERPVVVENTRIRHELEKTKSIEKMNMLVEQIIYQIEEYRKNGFSNLGIIGINRSPSCGINTTSKNDQEVEGQGVFIEMLKESLEKKSIFLNMVGVKGPEMDKALIDIKELLYK
ncbi:MAG: CD3072 family TudS-related putative desulfidase [Bacillota bacterium]